MKIRREGRINILKPFRAVDVILAMPRFFLFELKNKNQIIKSKLSSG